MSGRLESLLDQRRQRPLALACRPSADPEDMVAAVAASALFGVSLTVQLHRKIIPGIETDIRRSVSGTRSQSPGEVFRLAGDCLVEGLTLVAEMKRWSGGKLERDGIVDVLVEAERVRDEVMDKDKRLSPSTSDRAAALMEALDLSMDGVKADAAKPVACPNYYLVSREKYLQAIWGAFLPDDLPFREGVFWLDFNLPNVFQFKGSGPRELLQPEADGYLAVLGARIMSHVGKNVLISSFKAGAGRRRPSVP